MEPQCSDNIAGPDISYCNAYCEEPAEMEPRHNESTLKPLPILPPLGTTECEQVYVEVDGYFRWVNVCK